MSSFLSKSFFLSGTSRLSQQLLPLPKKRHLFIQTSTPHMAQNIDMSLVGDELFEVFDANNQRPLQIERRKVVHQKGLFHRAVNVLVFSKDGTKVLLQRRASNKDVCPNFWDLSCSEHLKVGESYFDGALRGLQEELSISATEPANLKMKKIYGPYFQAFVDQEHGIYDNEFQETWVCRYDGPIEIDPNELSEAKFVDTQAFINQALQQINSSSSTSTSSPNSDQAFVLTPWCLRAVSNYLSSQNSLRE
eukprot:TRINITY_DN1315_c0_g1_i1.p1 TRINITY_DN1315_c0_g1~~TRINITY_DN1315_c0_g1_i1.p1  ORF type:complete len:249 (+),score=62.88 TRINITY_DN1315_c0_g1_i1:51-797(+)